MNYLIDFASLANVLSLLFIFINFTFFPLNRKIEYLTRKNMSRTRDFIFGLMNELKPACIRVLALLFFIPIHDYFSQIAKTRLHKIFEHRLTLTLQRRRGINLNQPTIKLIIKHKIIAIKLKRILAIDHFILHALSRRLDLLNNLRPNLFLINILAFRIAALVILLNIIL